MKEIPLITPSSESDKNATKEAEYIANEVLEEKAKINAHNRRENFKDNLYWGVIILFWIIIVFLIIMGVIWAYHLVTPIKYHFLLDEQVNKIQTILFSASLVKISTDFIKDHNK